MYTFKVSSSVTVIDNFLPAHQHGEMLEVLLGADFPWYFNPTVVRYDEFDGNYQFTHSVVRDSDAERSWAYPLFEPMLERLGHPQLIRAKLNLGPRDTQNREAGFHVDYTNVTTAVFYVNTTNGSTKFADGTVVEGIANRLVEFDSNIPHTGVSHTDEQVRCVLNLNYQRPSV